MPVYEMKELTCPYWNSWPDCKAKGSIASKWNMAAYLLRATTDFKSRAEKPLP